MNKKIKIIIIVGVLFIVLSVGAVLALALFSKTDENIISNLKISYVYAEDEQQSTDSAVYREVYLTTQAENKVRINISSNVSNPRLVFQTSNEKVAYIQEESGSYYIYYVGAGTAKLTAYSVSNTEIYDYCTITVKENFATGISLTTQESYFVAYCDDNYNAYSLYYQLQGENVNLDLVGYEKNDPNHLIEKVEWNAKEKKFDFICNTNSKEGFVPVTVYTYVEQNGQRQRTAQETILVQIVKNKVEYIRAELYTDNDFSEESKVYYDGKTQTPTIYLGIEDSEGTEDSEFPSFIYIRLQKVYTNGTYEYIQYNTQNYVLVTFDSESSTTNRTFQSPVEGVADLTIQLTKFTGTEEQYKQLYSNETSEPAKYNFVYWDTRFRSPYEVADAEGNIISYTQPKQEQQESL